MVSDGARPESNTDGSCIRPMGHDQSPSTSHSAAIDATYATLSLNYAEQEPTYEARSTVHSPMATPITGAIHKPCHDQSEALCQMR